MTIPTTDSTRAAAFADHPAVASAIETIVRELDEARATITGVREPNPELAAESRARLDCAAALRGRAGAYPYLGSGLGNGPFVELTDGSVKWDMITGIGVHIFGHSDPDLVATAIRAALGDTTMQGNLQFNDEVVAMADLLVAEAARTSAIRHCFLTNSGAIANESAVKVCMQATGGHRFVAFSHGFAGRTLLLSQLGDNVAGRAGLTTGAPVDYVPFYDPRRGAESTEESVRALREILRRYSGQIACFCMELVQGEGGFNVAPREFFVALMTVCREHGVPVWADEVQTFGRTERMYHFEQLDLGEYIDVVTVGKMSQVCAALYTEALNPKPGLLSGTFIGSTVALRVGRRILERLRDGDYYGPDGHIARLHAEFRRQAGALVARHPDWFPPVPAVYGAGEPSTEVVGGVGGMMRLTPFAGEKSRISVALHAMFDEGLIGFNCGHGPYHIRLLPPVGVMEPEQMGDVFEIIERGLGRAAASD